MAVQDTHAKNSFGKTAAEKRKKAKDRIEKLKTQSSKGGQEKINKLQAALEKDDDELATFEFGDAMALDSDEEQENDKTDDGKGKEKEGDKEQDKEDGEEKKGGNNKSDATESSPKTKTEPSDGGSPLFVPDSVDDEEAEEAEEDPEYGRPLYHRPGPKTGSAKTVGWAGGRSIMYINQYGPKNAARHRLEKFADTAEYEDSLPEKEKVSNPKNRLGNETLDNGKFKYTKRHILAIYGVAWEGTGTGDSDADLDLIDPDLVQGIWKNTYVLIAWDVDGKVSKKWEPRQTLRSRWGKKLADEAIFNAACEAEERAGEIEAGSRKATSRSPSVGFATDTARRFREQSLAESRSSPSRGKSATPASTSRAKSLTPTRTTRSSRTRNNDAVKAELAELLEEFRIDYCECAGVDNFRELTPEDKGDFVKAWKQYKVDLVEAV